MGTPALAIYARDLKSYPADAMTTSKTTIPSPTFARCAAAGDFSGLASLLAQGAPSENEHSLIPRLAELSTALHLAAKNGHAQCVELLIPVSQPSADLSAALGEAAENGHADCLKLLIPVSEPRALGSRALCLAALNGHAECVKILIPVSDPKAHFSQAICAAASRGHLECVLLLIPQSESGPNKSKALRLAAENGHLACVRRLWPYSNCADVDHEAFRLAAENGHYQCAHYLRRSDPETFCVSLENGQAHAVAFMITLNPSLIDLIDLPERSRQASENGHHHLAALLVSIAETRAIASAIPVPGEPLPSNPSPRL